VQHARPRGILFRRIGIVCGYSEPHDSGRVVPAQGRSAPHGRRSRMYGVVYLVGLIVIVMAILSLIGLR
jgi:uncharacterized membrane protein YkgB